MKILLLLILAVAPALADDSKQTVLSPSAQETMDKVSFKITGTITAIKPHGFLVTVTKAPPELLFSDRKTIFVLMDGKGQIGDAFTDTVVYPMGNYSYATDDAGSMTTVPRVTDNAGLAADYVLTLGIRDPSLMY